jgi:hypothetical protein
MNLAFVAGIGSRSRCRQRRMFAPRHVDCFKPYALERKIDMRKIIAALVESVDGFSEGPSGELDWVETWGIPSIFFPRSTRVFSAAGCIRATNNTGEPYWPTPRASCPLPARSLRRAKSTGPDDRTLWYRRCPRGLRPRASRVTRGEDVDRETCLALLRFTPRRARGRRAPCSGRSSYLMA